MCVCVCACVYVCVSLVSSPLFCIRGDWARDYACVCVEAYTIFLMWPAIYIILYWSAEFASLTHAQLMEKVRALQNLAYRLGVEEGKPVITVSMVMPYRAVIVVNSSVLCYK